MRMVQKNKALAPPSVSSTVEIGYVSGVFGTRGEVKVFLHNPDSDLFKTPLSCKLVHDAGKVRSVVMTVRSGAGKKIIGRIDVCSTRDAAETVVGCTIVVDRASLPALDTNEFYISDLEQMSVITPGGQTFGTIAGVHQTGRGDMLEIHQKDEVFFVPLSDPFVAHIDIEKQTLELSETGMECL